MLSTWPANTDLTPCFAIERRQISVLAHGGAKWQYARCQTFCRFWRRPCASTRRCVCQRSLTGGVCQRSLSGSHCRPLSAPCRACTRRQTAAAGAGRGCGIRRAPPLPAAARWAPRRTAPSVVAFGCAAPTRPPARTDAHSAEMTAEGARGKRCGKATASAPGARSGASARVPHCYPHRYDTQASNEADGVAAQRT